MHVQSPVPSEYSIIYSHANAEDISQLYSLSSFNNNIIGKVFADGSLDLFLVISLLMTIQDMERICIFV